MEPDTNSPTPPQGSQIRHVAMNIVNQLGDHWAVPVADRQPGNDKADDFVAALITAQVQEAEAKMLAQMQSRLVAPFIDPDFGTVDVKGVGEATLVFIEAALQDTTGEK